MDWSASLHLSGKTKHDYGAMKKYWRPVTLRIPQSIPEDTSISRFNSPGYLMLLDEKNHCISSSNRGGINTERIQPFGKQSAKSKHGSSAFATFVICSIPMTLLSFFLLILALRQLAPTSNTSVMTEKATPNFNTDIEHYPSLDYQKYLQTKSFNPTTSTTMTATTTPTTTATTTNSHLSSSSLIAPYLKILTSFPFLQKPSKLSSNTLLTSSSSTSSFPKHYLRRSSDIIL